MASPITHVVGPAASTMATAQANSSPNAHNASVAAAGKAKENISLKAGKQSGTPGHSGDGKSIQVQSKDKDKRAESAFNNPHTPRRSPGLPEEDDDDAAKDPYHVDRIA